jgi:hypothetical protein
MKMNSSLVDKVIPAYSGNYTVGRSGRNIEAITIHHVAGVISVEALGDLWQRVGRNGSSHYGIGNDGRIGQYVNEKDAAWTNNNWDSNCKSITIEVSNCSTGGQWLVGDKAINSLIKLVADISKRNNLKLEKGKTVTWHSMFYNTACPGPYLFSKFDYIIEEANKLNAPVVEPTKPFVEGIKIYPKMDVFLYSNAGYGNASAWLLPKNTECTVAKYNFTNGIYMALKDVSGNYFLSTWTNEFSLFATEKPIIEQPKPEEQERPIENKPVEPQKEDEPIVVPTEPEKPQEKPITELEEPMENKPKVNIIDLMKKIIELILKLFNKGER